MDKNITKRLVTTLLLIPAVLGQTVLAKESWVERSDMIAYEVLESTAHFTPEFAGQTGVEGFDEEIFDLQPNRSERQIAIYRANIDSLESLLVKESDVRVRQDLQIIIKDQRNSVEATEIELARVLPYFNLPRLIFAGFNGLLDKQTPFERQRAALARLKKYTGQADGYTPISELARERMSERFDQGLIRPFKGEVEQDLKRSLVFINGLADLFAATELEGYEEDLSLLQDQLTSHTKWVEQEFLSRSREDAALPRELYELQLKNYGVDLSPEALIEIGRVAFMDIRNEMMALAPLVAAEKGYEVTDYRAVIKRLKEDQVFGKDLMTEYERVMEELDAIAAREGLVSLPEEPARVRMATPAESAQTPAAHLSIPRLVGNTGEFPEFIVPNIAQNADGTWPDNDYAGRAQMWTLAAHEARPGHEMQFTTMLKGGVSIARATFAFNSANVEGWALYAESIMKPHMPLEGQLMSLKARLLRAQRIWMDPMLNLGLATREEVKRLLMEEVVSSEASANNELDRYIFRIPGQATAYYYGYIMLQGLRADAEIKLADKFVDHEFHDFILAQGLLPPSILRQSVMDDFVAPRLESASTPVAPE
ncbi:MAG: DUF885 domain-containing protein [Gammaproteobacteria bacterium]|nr:DUF885 domain-containing protein [Gammaproteobacteria bacterium]MBT4493832.1 DUF885 domain-containing protein [Gammaproteobacteria bacterium]